MARSLPYRVSKRRCWFTSPSRMDARGNSMVSRSPFTKEYAAFKCKGTPIIWPKMSLTDQSTPLCEAHARHYYGDERIDTLITVGAIKVWKVSQENSAVQEELTVTKGDAPDGYKEV